MRMILLSLLLAISCVGCGDGSSDDAGADGDAGSSMDAGTGDPDAAPT